MINNRVTWFSVMINSPRFILVLRIFIGVIFTFSGTVKLIGNAQFSEIVQSYNIIPANVAAVYAWLLPWAEFIFGAYLFGGILIKPSAIAAILMGMTFMIANVHGIIQGNQYCGSCFGEAISIPVPISIVLDCLIIFIALYLLFTSSALIEKYSIDGWLKKRTLYLEKMSN